jgi:hypothetical protein
LSNFVKLYGSILYSTVWLEPLPTKVVWITMLALADADGVVGASVPGLAKIAGVSREECEAAIATLSAPEPDSRTKDDDGRRIQVVEGGWRIVNHRKYRDLRSETQVRTAERVRRHRSENDAASYVYYARDGERVKIGLSRNPWARVDEMRTARPTIALVAVERGGRDLERERHIQFGRKDFRNNERGAEWFDWTPEMEAHIATLAATTETTVGNGTTKMGASVTHRNGVKRPVRAEAEADAEGDKKRPKAKTKAPEQPSPFPKSACDELYETWVPLRGAINYGLFRKILTPLFPASGPRYTQQQLIDAIKAHAEYVEGLSPREAGFETIHKFAADVQRWVRVGGMPAVDPESRELTERGRLAVS